MYMKKPHAVVPRKKHVVKPGEKAHLLRNRLRRLEKKPADKITPAQQARLKQLQQELV